MSDAHIPNYVFYLDEVFANKTSAVKALIHPNWTLQYSSLPSFLTLNTIPPMSMRRNRMWYLDKNGHMKLVKDFFSFN